MYLNIVINTQTLRCVHYLRCYDETANFTDHFVEDALWAYLLDLSDEKYKRVEIVVVQPTY